MGPCAKYEIQLKLLAPDSRSVKPWLLQLTEMNQWEKFLSLSLSIVLIFKYIILKKNNETKTVFEKSRFLLTSLDK